MDTQTKPWTEMTEFEKFVDDLEGTLLARADAKDVAVVIERLQRAVAAERRTVDEWWATRFVASHKSDGSAAAPFKEMTSRTNTVMSGTNTA